MARWLVLLSLAWPLLLLAFGWQDQGAAFVATALLIALNACWSLHSLTMRRILPVPLSCVQVVLFGMLSYQLAAAFGNDHYRYDRAPGALDWIEFTLAHALRAVDLLDALDEYGMHVHAIGHASTSSALILAAMHFSVDAFLLGLFLRGAKRLWGEPVRETRLERGRRVVGWMLATVALYGVCAIALRLSPRDWLLWPLDNLLRLIDVGDLFQLFGWQLHDAPANVWTAGAAVGFRLAAGCWMARLVLHLRATVFRTWGLSINELIELLDDPEANIRRDAARGLGATGPAAATAVPTLIELLGDIDLAVRCEAARALGRIGPAAYAATAELVDAAWGSRRELRHAATTALVQIGPDAAWALSLTYLWLVGDPETRQAIQGTLARIAPDVLCQLRTAPIIAPEPKRKPWDDALDAALNQRRLDPTVRGAMAILLEEGYFVQERDTSAMQLALAEHGQQVHLQQLFMPLVALIEAGKLVRRKNKQGRWLYRHPGDGSYNNR